jgi:Rrf2 family protein
MKMPVRTIYGLQALFEISLHGEPEGAKATEIAQAQGVPLKFLEQILAALKKSKLVRSYRGREGGYVLYRPPKEITLLEVIEALEGTVSLTGEVRRKGIVVQTLKKIEAKFIEELRKVTFGELVEEKIRKEKISIYSI